jgi:hypothetical protein
VPVKYEADQKHELQMMNFGGRITSTSESPLVFKPLSREYIYLSTSGEESVVSKGLKVQQELSWIVAIRPSGRNFLENLRINEI